MFVKKNQVIVFVLALLLVTAGYLGAGQGNTDELLEANANQITELGNVQEKDENETLGDATLVNGTALVPNENNNVITTNSNTIDKNTVNQNTTNEVSESQNQKDDYFASSKLQRENMYSQSLESYQKIIDSSEISAEQKSIAQNEIVRINNEKNAIMIIENLIVSKGFSDVVIFINNNSVNVVVKANNLSTDGVAQIQNIVSRELNIEITNIHISTK